MPTPFTHLEIAQRLLRDARVPGEVRKILTQEKPAFLLGSVAADGRVDLGSARQDTHFYRYDQPHTGRAWRTMMRQHPTLWSTHHIAHQVFLAAYVAHLAVDEGWTLRMLQPHFANKEWFRGESRRERFRILHYLLSWMDERDWARLEGCISERLLKAEPEEWLPFFTDDALRKWRDRIAQQLPPGGESETLVVFGARIGEDPEEMRACLDDERRMLEQLWVNIPKELLQEVEVHLMDEAISQLLAYWQERQGNW